MVAPALHRVVLDTNTLVRGLIKVDSASGRILVACQTRRIIPLLSKPVVAEYTRVLTEPEITGRYPELSTTMVKTAIAMLRYVGDVIRPVDARFAFPRDPKDAMLIELAIAGRASHIITHDNDLLDLKNGRDDAAKRFRRRLPGVELLDPMEFIARYGGLV